MVLLLAAAVAVAAPRAPVEVVLGGQRLSATDSTTLRAAITGLAAQVGHSPVEVRAGGRTATASVSALGVGVDVEATLRRALRRVEGPGARALALLGQATVVPLVHEVTPATEVVAAMARELSADPIDATLELTDPLVPAVVPASDGARVDPQVLESTLVSALTAAVRDRGADAYEVEVPVEAMPPSVPTAVAAAAVPVVAAVADGTVLLADPDGRSLALLQGRDLAGWVRLGPDGPSVDPASVPPAVTASLLVGSREARNAVVVVDQQVLAPPDRDAPDDLERFGGTVRVEPAEDGLAVDPATTWARALAQAGPGDDVVEVVPAVDQAALSTLDAGALGVVEPISTFTTFYSPGQSRVTNIHRIAEIVDGAMILPGEPFELNHFVGERTRERGFVTGGAIANGEFVTDVGGGVSQFATTFFNAAWFAGVDLVEFQPHSYYISRYPEGREATIDYPTVNLEIRNDTPHAIVVATSVTDSSVSVTFWSTPYWTVESATGQRRSTSRGFAVEVTRTRTAPDGTSETRSWTADYRRQ